jgi:hypothetical protein
LNGESITAGVIAAAIKDKTKKLWNNEGEIMYYCDSNNILIQNDMIIKYSLPFVATSKGRLKSQMVETVKDWIFDERVFFSPNAEFVLKCMTSAHWAKSGDEFARSKIYGHYDAMAAVVYLIRNIDEESDAVPKLLGLDPFTHFIDPHLKSDLTGQSAALGSIFTKRR